MSKRLSFPVATPPCFDSAEEWNAWKEKALRCDPESELTYCTDCTPEYKAKMRALDRCQFPGTTFALVEGVIVGTRA